MKLLSQLIRESEIDDANGLIPKTAPKIVVSNADYDKWMKYLNQQKASSNVIELNSYLRSMDVNDNVKWELLRYSVPSSASSVASKLNATKEDVIELQKLIKSCGGEANAVPMQYSDAGRQSLYSNKVAYSEIIVDRQSNAGAKELLKTYASAITKYTNEWFVKCPLDKAELTACAREGIFIATRTYLQSKKETSQTFHQYLNYCIVQTILNEIHQNGYTIRLNQRAQEKMLKELGGVNPVFSYDANPTRNSDDDFEVDHFDFLGASPQSNDKDVELAYNKIKQAIASHFGDKQADIYMTSILDKQTVAAQQYGLDKGYISTIVKKISKWLRDNVKSNNGLGEYINVLMDVYTESILVNNINDTKKQFYERLINDDMFIMLNEMKRVTIDRDAVMNALMRIGVDSSYFISQCLKNGYNWMDSKYRRNKMHIIDFLAELSGDDNIINASDAEILQKMQNIIDMNINIE